MTAILLGSVAMALFGFFMAIAFMGTVVIQEPSTPILIGEILLLGFVMAYALSEIIEDGRKHNERINRERRQSDRS